MIDRMIGQSPLGAFGLPVRPVKPPTTYGPGHCLRPNDLHGLAVKRAPNRRMATAADGRSPKDIVKIDTIL